MPHFVTRNQFERKTARVWLEIHQQQLQGEEALVLWLLCKHECGRNKVEQLFDFKKEIYIPKFIALEYEMFLLHFKYLHLDYD